MKDKQSNTLVSRIEKLDNRLANQIAAGEVVDRPASVLKELLENSIDAGAKRIEVEIERGGTRLIKVTDDGSGINKEDLTLALTRHATSKIKKVEDLSAIYSLGFRGEALASISSVSRLTLTSRTHDESLAWQAVSEGRDMDVKIQPASAVAGTRIEVRDLFFNTPARQKFLRTERTEFFQIEDVFKRLALANFDVSFILKHNGKVIKRVPAVKLLVDSQKNDISNDKKQYKFIISEQEKSRLTTLCGKIFSDFAIPVKCEHENISIKAFVGGENCHRSESDIQYVFINNRAVKDKTLSHAIRLAYQDRLPQGRMPTYVVFLTIDAEKIDVNVHPTKHEVRFENQRDVHDLLFRSITEALEASSKLDFDTEITSSVSLENLSRQNVSFENQRKTSTINNHPTNNRYSQESVYQQSNYLANQGNVISDTFSNYQENKNSTDSDLTGRGGDSKVTRLGQGYSVINSNSSIWLMNELLWLSKCFSEIEKKKIKLPSVDLLFPVAVDIDVTMLEDYNCNLYLNNLGFLFSPNDKGEINLNAAPLWSKKIDNGSIILFFIACVNFFNDERYRNETGIGSFIDVKLIDEKLADKYLINYFLDLAVFDFEKDLSDLSQCIIELNSEMVAELFTNGKQLVEENRQEVKENYNETV